MKYIFFVCRYVEPFQSYVLPTDGGLAKMEVLPPNFLGEAYTNDADCLHVVVCVGSDDIILVTHLGRQ